MSAQTVGHVRRALQLMLWGVLLLVFDIYYSRTVGGEGFRFDFLNDAAGAALIAAGVTRLESVRVNRRYVGLIRVAGLGAIVLVLVAIRGHFISYPAPLPDLAWAFADVVVSGAAAAGCLALAWLWSGQERHVRLAGWWRWAGWAKAVLAAGQAVSFAALAARTLLGRQVPLAEALPPAPFAAPLGIVGLVIDLAMIAALLASFAALRREPAGEPWWSADEAPSARWRVRKAWGLAAAALLIGACGLLSFRQPPRAGRIRALPFDGWMMLSGVGGGASFSPDGARILTHSGGAVRILDAATGAELRSFEAGSRRIYDLTYDAAGARIAVSSGSVEIWDAVSGARLLQNPPEGADDRTVSGIRNRIRFSPDGAKLATMFYSVLVYDAASGAENLVIVTGEQDKSDSLGLAWSPDGAKIATSGQRGQVQIWDAATGSLLREFQGPGMLVNDVAWSPDGTKLATANDYNLAIVWDAETGERLREIAVTREIDVLLGRRPDGHPRDYTAAIAWSPDGAKLAIGSSDASAGVWDAASGEQLWRLDGHSDTVGGLSWHPDGTRLLSSSADGTTLLWDFTGR